MEGPAEILIRRRWLLLAAATLVMVGCLQGGSPGPEEPDVPANDTPFVFAGERAGLDYEIAGGLPIAADPYRLMGGVAVGDVNGDGWPDIYVADGGSITSLEGANALFINQQDGTFEERTRAWSADDIEDGRAPVLFDADNDGDLDLFIGNFGAPDRLLENTGSRFEDVTAEAGLGFRGPTMNAHVTDVNGDGNLDLFVGVYGEVPRNWPDNRTDARNGQRNLLYVNDGDGTFTEQAREAGITGTRWTLASTSTDVDRDGDLDLYVGNDFGRDRLYMNEGNGTFTEATPRLGHVLDRNAMAAEAFDATGDGSMEIYVTNIHTPGSPAPTYAGNILLVHDGVRWTDQAPERGIQDGGWGWDAETFDADNDGDLDLYAANGFVTRDAEWDRFYGTTHELVPKNEAPNANAPSVIDMIPYNETHTLVLHGDPPDDGGRPSVAGNQTDRFWTNDGTGYFDERADEWFPDLTWDGRAVASLDHDRDGDLDLLVTAVHEPLQLLENRNASKGHWLQIRLDPGPGGPENAPRSHVTVEAANSTQVREAPTAGGFMSQSEGIVHVGLGNETRVDRITVDWPWGNTTTVSDVAADQRVVVGPSGLLEGR